MSELLSRGPNHHFVIRGQRTHRVQVRRNLTEFHYFVLANIANQIYVVDAMTYEIRSDVHNYVTASGFTTLFYTLSYDSVESAVF